jgi:hypothetical protein
MLFIFNCISSRSGARSLGWSRAPPKLSKSFLYLFIYFYSNHFTGSIRKVIKERCPCLPGSKNTSISPFLGGSSMEKIAKATHNLLDP